MKMQCGVSYLVYLIYAVSTVVSHQVVDKKTTFKAINARVCDPVAQPASESRGQDSSFLVSSRSSVAPPSVVGRLPTKKLSAHIASLLDSISHRNTHTVIP